MILKHEYKKLLDKQKIKFQEQIICGIIGLLLGYFKVLNRSSSQAIPLQDKKFSIFNRSGLIEYN